MNTTTKPSPVQVAIVDDEVNNINLISKYLNSYPSQIQISGRYSTPQEALSKMSANMPDVVLLDIEMPGLNGFDLLQELNSPRLEVIFITGHDEYALKAIKCAAIDYILKPFGREELHQALNKVRSRMKHKIPVQIQDNPPVPVVKNALDTYVPGTKFLKSAIVQNALYLRAVRGGSSMFSMVNGANSLASYPLNYYESLLINHGFFRTHKSQIINMQHVVNFDPTLLTATLANKEEIQIAIRRKALFMQIWDQKMADQ